MTLSELLVYYGYPQEDTKHLKSIEEFYEAIPELDAKRIERILPEMSATVATWKLAPDNKKYVNK